MWARRKCGVPRQWPSRTKVVLQSFMSAAIGIAVYQFMEGADVGYLDLKNPKDDNVLCVSRWPVRHDAVSWLAFAHWADWGSYRVDMKEFVIDHACDFKLGDDTNKDGITCAKAQVPLHSMSESLGIPLGLEDYDWRNDTIEFYGFLFLYLTFCLWVVMLAHDLALLTVRKRDFIYDLRGIRNNFRCWKVLYMLLGFRWWKRLFRKKGIMIWGVRALQGKTLSRMLAVVIAPISLVWAILSFFIFSVPATAVTFFCWPVRLSRGLLFINALSTGFVGVVMTLHMIVFAADKDTRQVYAVTWDVTRDKTTCKCGCVYPISGGRSLNLMLIGVIVTYKSFHLAFRCLKGLRRSNWANLMTVTFPVPLTVYEVDWRRPDGQRVQRRTAEHPVQGELAFDPFTLMDEQPESARTSLVLAPSPIEEGYDAHFWAVNNVVEYFKALRLDKFVPTIDRLRIDGNKLVEICQEDKLRLVFGLDKLSNSEARKICDNLGRWKPPPVDINNSTSSLGAATGPRSYRGPMITHLQDLPKEKQHLEYIGCCGFPCRRFENSRRLENSHRSDSRQTSDEDEERHRSDSRQKSDEDEERHRSDSRQKSDEDEEQAQKE